VEGIRRKKTMWTECVLDASMGCRDGMFIFCPIEGNIDGEFTVVTGMNFGSAEPPKGMKMVAIVHPDGQAAVEAFCELYKDALEALKNRIVERSDHDD
jgi:hypothetical protein